VRMLRRKLNFSISVAFLKRREAASPSLESVPALGSDSLRGGMGALTTLHVLPY